MNVKTVVNGKGEIKGSRIEIPIEGKGGAMGMHAVQGLTALISRLKELETPEEIEQNLYMIFGWGLCCQHCGFLTEKSTDDIMHLAEHLAEQESKRAAAEMKKAGNK